MSRPHVLLICCDDLGVRDLGCTGSTFYETPHIDSLARDGVLCADAYAPSPVCSPSRASLQTGRHCARVGITNYIPGNAVGRLFGAPYRHELGPAQTTIATLLQAQGYATWQVGKWHLGGSGSLPTDHGYQVNIAGGHWGGPWNFGGYRAPWCLPDGTAPPGLEAQQDGEGLCQRLAQEALDLIRGRDRSRPFFLSLNHYAPHTPIQTTAAQRQRFAAKAQRLRLDAVPAMVPGEEFPCLHKQGEQVQRRIVQSDPEYAGLLAELDDSVGLLVDGLRDEGILDDTLIIFTSDNGGLATAEGSPTCNLPWAEGKGWLEDGGLRVPFIVRWPQALPAARHLAGPVTLMDVMPTLLAAGQLAPRPDLHQDGIDLLPALRGEAALDCERPLFWHYPHYSNQGCRPGSALRRGRWKLHHCYEDDRVMLCDVEADPAEVDDHSARQPALVEDLRRQLDTWRAAVGAQAPVPNPDYEAMRSGAMPCPDRAGR